MKYTAKKIEEISHGEPIEIASFITNLLLYIEKLEFQIEQQKTHIVKLETRVKELERQVGLTSTNSSKPPSSDGLRKPKSLRKSGGYIRRQVFDLPIPRVVVTEHRIEKKCCPNCGTQQHAPSPGNVKAPVQYGDNWIATCAYLHTYHHLPLERISQLFHDMTGYRPSEATLLHRLSSISTKIEPHTAYIREELLKSAVVHADETGMRIEDKTQWLHTVSGSDWTLYHVHEKRGKIAIKDHDVLPKYHGILVHDCWASYFTADYSFDHALCGAHLLRECQGIIDYDGHQWAADMKELLQEACHHKKKWRLENIPIKEADALEWEMRYDRILERGAKEWVTDPVADAPLKRGRKKKSKAANLATRFLLHKTAILRFIRDARVPFDNSQAERDIRMMKVKQKVSGHFRTLEGAKQFAEIRGFISTLRKQDRDILSSLLSVTRGEFSFK